MIARTTAQTTQAFFEAADRHFEDEEPLLAYDNLWEAAAHALTAVSDARGWPTGDLQDLRTNAERLASEASDHHLRHQFAVAQQFRARFNEGFVERHQLADYCRLMREFVDRMLALLDGYGQVVPQSSQEHAGAARDSLRSAEAEFAAGNLTAGSDRLWQAAVHAVTAVARERGWPSDGHRAVKAAADRLAAGDHAVIAGFFAVQQFHANATHDFMEPDDVARGLPLVQDFVQRALALLEI
ncbi:MAG: hypothetical protein OXL37_04625 [Chloroflexota bacterium]|nr:hypothetical protein [Chloroflexota bacterium]MDE2960996.1 hypothetical protein [Chloroflexota bacterium]